VSKGGAVSKLCGPGGQDESREQGDKDVRQGKLSLSEGEEKTRVQERI